MLVIRCRHLSFQVYVSASIRYYITIRTDNDKIANDIIGVGEIKQIVRTIKSRKHTLNAGIASNLIKQLLQNVNYKLEIEKKYLWTSLLHLCEIHKLPEIYCNLIWKDIQLYFDQNQCEINQSCLSSLIMYYTNNEQFNDVINVLFWLDNTYNNHNNTNNTQNIITLNPKMYTILLSKLTKLTPNHTFNQTNCLDAIKYVHSHLYQYAINNTRIYNALIGAFAKYGDIESGKNVFDNIHTKYTDSFNNMMQGYYMNILEDNWKEYNQNIIELYNEMKTNNIAPDHISYLFVIKACSDVNMLTEIVDDIVNNNSEAFMDNIKIITTLIIQYSECGDIASSKKLFDSLNISYKDDGLYKTMMKWLIEFECFEDVLDLYDEMKSNSMHIDDIIYLNVIKSCNDNEDRLIMIIDDITSSKYVSCIHILNALITQFGKCNNINASIKIFEHIDESLRDSITYNGMMNVYREHGQYSNAIDLYYQMKEKQVNIDFVTYLVAIKSCFKNINHLITVHNDIIKSKLDTNTKICNSLIRQYSSCNDIQSAFKVFQSIPIHKRDIILYSLMMVSFKQHYQYNDVMRLYNEIKTMNNDLCSNETYYITALQCCGTNINYIRMINDDINNNNFGNNVNILSALMIQYMACGDINRAQDIFNNMDDDDNRDVVYNAKIIGLDANHAHDNDDDILTLYNDMKLHNIDIDIITNILTIKSCKNDIHKLNKVYNDIKNTQYLGDVRILRRLCIQFAICNDLEQTKEIMNNIHSAQRDGNVYNTMMKAFRILECFDENVINLYNEMKQNPNIHMNNLRYKVMIKACGNMKDLNMLNVVYKDRMKDNEYKITIGVLNEFIVQFSKCNDIETAKQIFDEIIPNQRNEWTYKAIVDAFIQHNRIEEVVNLYKNMENNNIHTPEITQICQQFILGHKQ